MVTGSLALILLRMLPEDMALRRPSPLDVESSEESVDAETMESRCFAPAGAVPLSVMMQ